MRHVGIFVVCPCTLSSIPWHCRWLKAGHHVITANKRLGAGPLQKYKEVQTAVKAGSGRFYYEACPPPISLLTLKYVTIKEHDMPRLASSRRRELSLVTKGMQR